MAPKRNQPEASSSGKGKGKAKAKAPAKAKANPSKKPRTKQASLTIHSPTNTRSNPPSGPRPPTDPILLKQRFISTRANTNYKHTYLKKNSIFGRTLDESVDENFYQSLKARKWEKLLTAPADPPNLSIVREFWENFSVVDLESELVTVRGVDIPFYPEAINRHYCIPDVPAEEHYQTILDDKKAKGVDRMNSTY